MPYLSISRKLRRILFSFFVFFYFFFNPSLMISRGTSVTVKFGRRSHCQESRKDKNRHRFLHRPASSSEVS
ncbi:hypothetical protein BDV40DRAFT_266642 [Aspergillus tamarii]|uniref:Uncharacterized protein n=1 Tax=Aspergillus tamarii TaxID=41984 RepID=A0A5N6UT07_ASPTM|nr:hypothetical protein BDV40DRAFT_266642 [Aspergillus tamarii]